MQPASMKKRVQILLHNPSRSALADVLHGPYPTGARPAYQRTIVAVAMLLVSPILYEFAYLLCGLLVRVPRPFIVMHGQDWSSWICDRLTTEPRHDPSFVQGCIFGSFTLWYALCDRVPGAILLVLSYTAKLRRT
eukprot:3162609-Prymnesium_polylepis.1